MRKSFILITKKSNISRLFLAAMALLIALLSFLGCTSEVHSEYKGSEKSESDSSDVKEDNINADKEVIAIKTEMNDTSTEFGKSENEDDSILNHFDLSDPKIYWDGRVDIEFHDDVVSLIMRKTNTYPKLELHDFGLSNAKSIEYIMLKPNSGTIKEKFRQILRIKLKEPGKENVIEAIKHFETLEFIRYAGPIYVCYPKFEPVTFIPIDH